VQDPTTRPIGDLIPTMGLVTSVARILRILIFLQFPEVRETGRLEPVHRWIGDTGVGRLSRTGEVMFEMSDGVSELPDGSCVTCLAQ
jgi:hypothetical protein